MKTLIFITLIIVSELAMAGGPTCARIFVIERFNGKPQVFSIDERSTLSNLQLSVMHDTTGLRAERKFTANGAQYRYAIKKLGRIFGPRLTLRDTPPEGKLNLTETEYVNPYKFHEKGESGDLFTAKFRVRKYLTYDKATGETQRAAVTRNKAWMEFKVDHPDYDNVVTKHRVLAPDTVIERLMQGSVSKQERAEILSVLALDPINKDTAAVEEFLKLFTSLNPEGAKSILDIIYARDAYQIKIPTLSGRPLDIQITVDRSVNFKAPKTSDHLLQYPIGARVIEIKVPVSHANLDQIALLDAPDLVHIKWLIDYFSDRVMTDFTEDVGKFGHFKKLYQ
ncbi:hypothetical protein D3C87_1258190 [compost metagenome]